MRRTREDPVIGEILDNYRRAGATLLGAAGLATVWLAMILATMLLPLRGLAASVAAGLVSPAGWGALGLLGLSLLQYAHAWLHLRSLGSNPRDDPRRRHD